MKNLLFIFMFISSLAFGQKIRTVKNFNSPIKGIIDSTKVGDSVWFQSVDKYLVRVERKKPVIVADQSEVIVVNPGNNNDITVNFRNALNIAKPGQTIVIPAGTFTALSTMVVNKKVNVRGAGIGKTIIYRPESLADGLIYEKAIFSYDNVSKIEFSGLTLKSKNYNTSVAEDIGIELKFVTDFLVDECRFENFGNSAVLVRHNDSIASGVICRNEFYHNQKGDKGLGLGYGVSIYGESKVWRNTIQWGSSNFIFIEDNTFDRQRHSVAAGSNALYVARRNVITNNYINDCCAHAIDAHEGNGTVGSENRFSTRAAEVYENIIINTNNFNDTPISSASTYKTIGEKAICFRGGYGLVYDNQISGYRFGVTVNAYKDTVIKQNKPIIYSWGNKFTPINVADQNIKAIYNYTPIKAIIKEETFVYRKFTYPHPLRSK